MLGKFYSRKITQADRNQAFVYKRRMESAPKQNIRIWDDTDHKNPKPSDTIKDLIKEEQQLVQSIKTNFNMATVRFMRYIQEIEIKYAFSFDDRVLDLDMDGTMTFHLNNIDGWHP